MNTETFVLVGFCITALVAVGFFAVFRGRGKIDLKGPGGVRLKAEGENPPPPGAVAAGVKIKGAQAGGALHVRSAHSEGGIDLDSVSSKGEIDATHTPGETPPKS